MDTLKNLLVRHDVKGKVVPDLGSKGLSLGGMLARLSSARVIVQVHELEGIAIGGQRNSRLRTRQGIWPHQKSREQGP